MSDGTFLPGLGLALVGALLVLATGQGTRGATFLGFVIATLLVAGFGARVMAPLALFVLGAGALTRIGRDRKERARAAEANRGRRGASHVAAKLGLPALLAIVAIVRPGALADLGLLMTAALAGAFADTAATEAGPLGGGGVIRLRGFRLVRAEHGEPGAMSLAGLAAAAGAAVLLAGTARAVGVVTREGDLAIAASAGFVATLLESAAAGSSLGARLGHSGRNVFVSVGAAALAWLAGVAAPGCLTGVIR